MALLIMANILLIVLAGAVCSFVDTPTMTLLTAQMPQADPTAVASAAYGTGAAYMAVD